MLKEVEKDRGKKQKAWKKRGNISGQRESCPLVLLFFYLAFSAHSQGGRRWLNKEKQERLK